MGTPLIAEANYSGAISERRRPWLCASAVKSAATLPVARAGRTNGGFALDDHALPARCAFALQVFLPPQDSSLLSSSESLKVRLSHAASGLHTGFATFLVSFPPVLSSTNSLQLTGTIWLPASLTAITTPSSFFAVLQK